MLRYVKSGMMLMSIAYIVLGLMLLIMPETSLLWICYAFGVVVLITGIVCLIQYTSIKGAVKPVPRMRAYWIRQTMPVISTTTPKAE